MNQTAWFSNLRAILELLYFLSGVAIAVAAVLALEQIRVTRQIARQNSRRESVKLAAELCKYYGEVIVVQWDSTAEEYRKANATFLDVHPPDGQSPFVLEKGEIVRHHFNIKALKDEWGTVPTVVHCLNKLEAFAIPVVAGAADEDIAFRETSRPFCQSLTQLMPAIFHLRMLNAGRYESAVKLYEMWNPRLVAEIVAPAIKAMEQVSKASKQRIRPLE